MKKIISLLSACAIFSSFAFSVSAEPVGPTVSLSVDATGYKAGDTVTVVCNYSGFDVTPYSDDTGYGQKVTGVQLRVNIPGGIGSAAQGELFLRPGVTNVYGFATGAPQHNWDIANNTYTLAASGIDDPMQNSGTAFTISMKLNKDITEDLVFNFVADYEQNIVYDNYEDWTMGTTVQNKITGENLVSYTLKAPVSDIPVESVTLDKSSVELDLNGTTTATLTATVTPDNATDKTVTWTTSDADVATVENGVVTAKKVGTATITAKAGDKSATCEVTVTDSTPVTPVMPAKGTVIVDAVEGKVVIYADSKNASEIGANATFEIEYTGTNEELKRADGTYKKAIKRTFGEILGGEIGEGKVTGKVHFGIKIPESVSEADRAFFTINVK